MYYKEIFESKQKENTGLTSDGEILHDSCKIQTEQTKKVVYVFVRNTNACNVTLFF